MGWRGDGLQIMPIGLLAIWGGLPPLTLLLFSFEPLATKEAVPPEVLWAAQIPAATTPARPHDLGGGCSTG